MTHSTTLAPPTLNGHPLAHHGPSPVFAVPVFAVPVLPLTPAERLALLRAQVTAPHLQPGGRP